jgi:non-heme chloroperoxidase
VALRVFGDLQAYIKGVYDCIQAFSETDFTDDLKKIDVLTLILQGDADQIVPIDDASRLSAKIVKHSTLKVYPGAPHADSRHALKGLRVSRRSF